jgi:hypothetical protein
VAKGVIHLSKVRQLFGLKDCVSTGTLCNRMSNATDDLNVTTRPAAVTCKCCLRLMDASKAKNSTKP